MKTTEYTEKEILKIAMDEGLTDDTEINTKSYQERGYIKGGKLLDIFIEKLEQKYEYVSLKINPRTNRPFVGKKRIYIIGEERETIKKRFDGRSLGKGQPLSEEGQIINEHIFAALKETITEEQNNNYTVSLWSKYLGFPYISPDRDGIDYNKYLTFFIDYYNLANVDFFRPHELVREFIDHYNKSVDGIVLQAFKRLEKRNLIKVTNNYFGHASGSTKTAITKEQHDSFKEKRIQLIEESGYNYRAYWINEQEYRFVNSLEEDDKTPKLSVKRLNNIKEFGKIHERIKNELFEQFGSYYVYETYEIEIVDKLYHSELLSHDELKDYFNTEYLKRTRLNRYQKNEEHYINSTYFWRAFFYLSTTLALGEIDKEVAESFEEDLRRYVLRYDLDFGLKYRNMLTDNKEENIRRSNKLREKMYKLREKGIDLSSYDYSDPIVKEVMWQSDDSIKFQELEENCVIFIEEQN